MFSQWQQHRKLNQKEIRTHFRSICSFGSNGWVFSYEKILFDTIQSSCFPPWYSYKMLMCYKMKIPFKTNHQIIPVILIQIAHWSLNRIICSISDNQKAICMMPAIWRPINLSYKVSEVKYLKYINKWKMSSKVKRSKDILVKRTHYHLQVRYTQYILPYIFILCFFF